ncbi:hypothetical protein OK348_06515 [Flavobacterium sp. MXW15]|uniref:Classical arabinogalactan protein 4 n=1 Tax=Xanthomonas chitinilytica TaxID=2989819 RepID=A0ABT3JTC3_9XANT|nr:classical arabinogalactan protein 4 [Xanthomonas sp. H13-6]MCW4454445.1 hypothetical protein [Flavobacterium sp. MXW15]MCW4471685.1 classical arabinogalactan protein 4 [Xanthomonas sp. H13-6]
MKRTIRTGCLLLALAPLLAQAQIKPAAPTATDNEAIRQRLSTHPIDSKGPAQPVPPAKPVAPTRVYDRNGRVLHGMKPAGPNRVMDTRTGRYHDTVPSGDGQRIER